MKFSYFLKYLGTLFQHVPWTHLALIGILSIALSLVLIFRKKYSVYCSIVLGILTFISLFLLDVLVLIRYLGIFPHSYGISFKTEYYRLLHGPKKRPVQVLLNIIAFIPLGFLGSEFLSGTSKFYKIQQLWVVTLAGFCYSLIIESLQLVLHVGYFELTDLLMNTIGAFLGVGLALLGKVLFSDSNKRFENS